MSRGHGGRGGAGRRGPTQEQLEVLAREALEERLVRREHRLGERARLRLARLAGKDLGKEPEPWLTWLKAVASDPPR